MYQNNDLLYAFQTLGHDLEEKDLSIRAKKSRIEFLEKELETRAALSEENAFLRQQVEDLRGQVSELQDYINARKGFTVPQEIRGGEIVLLSNEKEETVGE